ncbi:MAG: hypothetical protein WCP68_05415, partial [Enhydrobacter sp.]
MRFEVIHQKLTGFEAFTSVGRRYRHHHDLIGRRQFTYAVNHPGLVKVKTLVGFIDHGFNRFFGHPLIMLQRHGLDLIVRMTRQGPGITHRTHKTAHGT